MSGAAPRADGAGDSTPGSDVGERITRLFPKCRPKNMQHHHERYLLNSGLDGRETNLNDASSDEEEQHPHPAKGYKLRDSRIIEIAGGRELYSQSRAKAVRKLRHNNGTHKHSFRSKRIREAAEPDPVLEMSTQRIINEPKKISRHTSPSYRNGDREPPVVGPSSLAIPRNSSPILDPHKKTTDASAKSSPIAVVADGEVVVFDDNDDWKVILNSVSLGLRMDPEVSDDELDMSVKRTLDSIKNGDSELNNKGEISCDGDSESTPSREGRLSGTSPGLWRGEDDKNRYTRVIGELPIAEYEGSPRRYGVGSQKIIAPTNNRSPRPGFPKRVVAESREPSPTSFDYLYEFSETRKVLEEFFKGPGMAGQQVTTDEVVNFQELDYSLRRQTQASPEIPESVDSAVPWSGRLPRDDSPRDASYTDFLGLQGLQSLAAYGGAAWGGASPPRAPSRPFALSSDSSGSVSDLSAALPDPEPAATQAMESRSRAPLPLLVDGLSSGHDSDTDNNNQLKTVPVCTSVIIEEIVENGTSNDTHATLTDADLSSLDPLACSSVPPPAPAPHRPLSPEPYPHTPHTTHTTHTTHTPHTPHTTHTAHPPHSHPVTIVPVEEMYPAPPLPPHANNRKRPPSADGSNESVEVKPASGDEDEADTDLETDRLLGQQRTDDQGFFDDKGWRKPKSRTVMPGGSAGSARSPSGPEPDARPDDLLVNGKDKDAKKKSKNKEDMRSVLIEGVLFRARYLGSTQLACEGQPTKATRMLQAEEAVSRIKWGCDGPYSGVYAAPAAVFRLTFLGSVEVEDSRRKKKRLKKNMVEEAVSKIKAPEGENQPSTEVDLFISTEKIMVLNTELKEIMMDHALRTISYIADIGDLVVLMARRRFVPHENDSDPPKLNRTPKMICHVFESEEAQFIAQSIGQAFQVAYMEFLKANGIEDHSFVKEMDYQEVLNSQEIFGDELQMFAKKELQKEVVVPKAKGEILGVVVVESGWGSMLPTVVIANLAPAGAAARCGQLNIGDQIIAINGVSLVGLPLSTCQTYIKHSKAQTVVKLTVVPCAPVVEVKIKRPDTKYQLGFSVQNGVICSLLRGGIAERGGVRVGHRIIEINAQSVVAVPHERIVNLLATSVGEILMKTMPTSMFRLLTGQENPVFI